MKFRFQLKFFVFALWLNLLFINVKAQLYNFRVYGKDEGLNQTQVLSIIQDDKGYMWFGTNGGGINRFDGKNFKTFDVQDSLASNYVFDIVKDKKGTLYFATAMGLSVYDGTGFKNYRQKDSLKNIFVQCLEYDYSRDLLWIGTAKGLYTMKDGKISAFKTELDTLNILSRGYIECFYADRKRNLWIGTRHGYAIKYSVNGNITYYNNKSGIKGRFIESIAEDKSGAIWFNTIEGFNRMDKYGFFTYPSFRVDSKYKEDNFQVSCNKALVDRDKNIWFATQNGLVKETENDDMLFCFYGLPTGAPSMQIHDVYQDREGNYWLGTNDVGIVQFNGFAFSMRNAKSDSLALLSNTVTAIYATKNGRVFTGYDNAGLVEYNAKGEFVKRYTVAHDNNNGLGGSKVAAITEFQNSVVFGQNRGLSFLKNDVFSNVHFEKFGITDNVYSLQVVDNKGILIGANKGVYWFDGQKILVRDEFKDIRWSVLHILKSLNGDFYFSTEAGLYKCDKNFKNLKRIKADNFKEEYIRCTVMDKNGRLWVSGENGLYYYYEGRFHSVGPKSGFYSKVVYSMKIDKEDNLWLGHITGIDKLSIDNFNKTKTLTFKSYTKLDGFIGKECYLNALDFSSNGNVFVGTQEGLLIFNPALDKINKEEPIIHITEIKMFDQSFDFSPYCDSINSQSKLPVNLVLPHNLNNLTFDFVGISLTIPERVRYKYMLEGQDEDWSQVTSKNEITFSNISPGTYVFKVIACNNDEIWDHEPTVFRFTIEPPIWQRPWFISLMIIILIGLIYAFIKVRERALVESKKRLENTVEERTKELREEKEKVEAINLEVTEQKAIIEEKNKDITDSINYAKRIQDAVLPSKNLITKGYKESFILYKPKDIVSGDFYWFAEGANKYFIASADCTGHGVPGAFMSMIGNNLLNQIVKDHGVDVPGKVLTNLNNELKNAFSSNQHQFDTKDGMDIALCAYDPVANTLEFAGANRPLYFIRNGELTEVKGTKSPIGAQTPIGFAFETKVFSIEKGDSFYATSDGYADQFGGPDGKKFMTKKLKELLVQIHQQPMKEQQEILSSTILNWMGKEHEQIDDELVIGFRF